MKYLFIIAFIFAINSFCGEFPSPNQNNKDTFSQMETFGKQIVSQTKQIFSLKSQVRDLKSSQLSDYEMLSEIAKKQGIRGDIEFDECDRSGLCFGDEAWFVRTDCYRTKKFSDMDFCAKHFVRELYSLSKKNNSQASAK